jgi:glucose/arabinose dehydrogenase
MKKIALLVALAVLAAAPAAVAKTKKPAKPAQQVQTDPQKMTFDEAMEVNKKNLSLIPQGLPLILPSWSLPAYFALTKEEEPAKPARKHAKKTM